MQAAGETLEAEGVDPEHIELVLDTIAEATRDLFETYDDKVEVA